MERSIMRALTAMALMVSRLAAFQEFVPAKEREGLHHADVRGQFVSPTGEPVARVVAQLFAGGPRAIPIASVRTGADGRFVFRDVNSRYAAELRIYPPEQWMKSAIAVVGESGETIELGTIRLIPDTVIRMRFETPIQPGVWFYAGGPPGSGASASVERSSSGLYTIRQITFDEGTLEIRIFASQRTEYYRAPFRVERGRNDQFLVVRPLPDTVQRQGYEWVGRLEIEETSVPLPLFERDFEAKGRVLDPEGRPLEGVQMNTALVPGFPFPAASSLTDKDGRYRLTYRWSQCWFVWPYWGSNAFELGTGPNDKIPTGGACPTDAAEEVLTLKVAERLTVLTPGIDTAQTRAYWWDASLGWQKFNPLQAWVPKDSYGESILKLEADGYLPVRRVLPASGSAAALPRERLEVRFEDGASRELVVMNGARPIEGALVDVELVTDVVKDERQPLATYRTPVNGRLRFAGSKDVLLEVFVYAEGFEPVRTIWNPGQTLNVDMAQRDATFTFGKQPTRQLIRIREIRSPQTVRTVRLEANQAGSVALVPGTYDLTVYDDKGTVAGYQRQAAVRASTTAINLRLDQRPRLIVRYPEWGWEVTVSSSTPPGGSVQWVTWGYAGGTLAFRDIAATLVRQGSKETELLLSQAGKMHVELKRRGESMSRWRDIEVRPGESVTIELPAADGQVRGAMRTYQTGASAHGYAGPRLQLIAEDPTGWSLTEYIPSRENADAFTLREIPAGNYYLHQHLIGEVKTFRYSDGYSVLYSNSINAWGGIPVRVAAGQVAQLKDFIDYPLRGLVLEVRDASGQPLENATVRVLDRMWDAWRVIEEDPWQIRQAANPIPPPAAARVAAGKATLPQIRSGKLELVVEVDGGGRYRFSPTVGAEGPVLLTLPGR